MKATRIGASVLALVLAPLVVSGAHAQGKSESSHQGDSKPRFEVTEEATDTLKILKIDKGTRLVTLRNSPGDTVAVLAGKEVRNFDQLRVNDRVVTRISSTLMIHVQEGGEAEMVQETKVDRAEVGEKPRGSVTERKTYKAKIVSIDKAAGTATLKGPDAEPFTVTPKNPANLDRVNVGDVLVVQHTVSTAVWIAKPGAKPAAKKATPAAKKAAPAATKK